MYFALLVWCWTEYMCFSIVIYSFFLCLFLLQFMLIWWLFRSLFFHFGFWFFPSFFDKSKTKILINSNCYILWERAFVCLCIILNFLFRINFVMNMQFFFQCFSCFWIWLLCFIYWNKAVLQIKIFIISQIADYKTNPVTTTKGIKTQK